MVPENEQGVVVLFAQQAKQAGFEFISIGTAFPDARISKNGVEYRIEFEYLSSNFWDHRHDPRKCDLIICWQDNHDDCILPVLALTDPNWAGKKIELPTDVQRELAYWKYRALSAEQRLQSVACKQIIEEGVYTCSECSRNFGSIQALNAHMRFCTGTVSIDANGNKPQ